MHEGEPSAEDTTVPQARSLQPEGGQAELSLESGIREAVAFTGLVCATGKYTGSASAYLVMNHSTLPTHFADDEPEDERLLVQLHLYCPTKQNTVQLRADIKRAIHEAGFSYPSTVDATDETGQHVVFEFEGLGAV